MFSPVIPWDHTAPILPDLSGYLNGGSDDGRDGPFDLPDGIKPPDRDKLVCTTEQPLPVQPSSPDPGDGCRKAVENIIERCTKIESTVLRRACFISAIPLLVLCQGF